jgi:uncharacterized membrane protein YbhN (UPF0104 family)
VVAEPPAVAVVAEPPTAAMVAPPPATAWWSRRWLRVALLGAGAVGAVVALDGRLPDAGDVLAVATGLDLRWAAVALLAQVASQAMFGYQQRRLLHAFEVDISARRATAIAYSRTAISMALPAGSAVSAAFAAQQYRQRGATLSTATLVAILSGIASVAGLVLLYAAGLLGTVLTQPGESRAVVLAGLATLVAVAVLARSTLAGSASNRSMSTDAAHDRPVVGSGQGPSVLDGSAHDRSDLGHRAADRSVAGRSAVRRMRQALALVWGRRARRVTELIATTARRARAVPARHWAAAIAFAAANWLLDLACLAAAAAACHLSVGYGQLAGIYLAAQVARQLPITPGGIGLIETSLLTGLVTAGAIQANAAAAVLGYRLVSFWLILPIGAAAYLGLRRCRPASV